MSGKRHPPEVVLRAVRSYKAGDKVPGICAEAGVNLSVFYAWLRRMKIPLRGHGGPNMARPGNRNATGNRGDAITKAKAEEVVRLAQAGEKFEYIAAHVGVCDSTVRRYVRAAGLPKRRGGRQKEED